MAGKIPKSFIDDLLVRVDIIDLIDSYVPLKKSGSNYFACCPFHTEKTPSFSVTRSKQIYHCFGCGTGGNAISFLIDYNHLSFVEAIETLADFMGLDVPREQQQHNSQQNNGTDIFKVLEQATEYYSAQLNDKTVAQQALKYLESRGLAGDVFQLYQIGFAPDNWHNLAKKFPEKALLDAGLVAKKEHQAAYDRFRARIMFPIRDRRGRTIGFGGRILDDTQPKYLNSPETAVFHKNNEVYGLYEVLTLNAKPKYIIVVEGYLDVISLAQFNIRHAVATLGTAVSKEHLELLFRFSSEIIFCFDGDKAGKAASWRGVIAALPSLRDGRQIKIAGLPTGIDPDDFIREHGTAAFEEILNEAQSLSDFFFSRLSEGLNLNNMEGRASLVSKATVYLNTLPHGIFQDLMLEKLKSLSQVKQLKLIEQTQRTQTVHRKKIDRNSRISPIRLAISLLLQNPHLITELDRIEISWETLALTGIDLFKHIVEIIHYHPDITLAGLIEAFRGQKEEKYIIIMMNYDFSLSGDALKQEFSGSINRLVHQGKEQKLNALITQEREIGLNEQERIKLLALLRNVHEIT